MCVAGFCSHQPSGHTLCISIDTVGNIWKVWMSIDTKHAYQTYASLHFAQIERPKNISPDQADLNFEQTQKHTSFPSPSSLHTSGDMESNAHAIAQLRRNIISHYGKVQHLLRFIQFPFVIKEWTWSLYCYAWAARSYRNRLEVAFVYHVLGVSCWILLLWSRRDSARELRQCV